MEVLAFLPEGAPSLGIVVAQFPCLRRRVRSECEKAVLRRRDNRYIWGVMKLPHGLLVLQLVALTMGESLADTWAKVGPELLVYVG